MALDSTGRPIPVSTPDPPDYERRFQAMADTLAELKAPDPPPSLAPVPSQ